MTFLSMDSGETLINKKASDFELGDFLPYTMAMFKNQFGFRLVIDETKDRAVYRWLMKTYGSDAGNIVKWVFYRYKGTVSGESFGPTMFSMNHKWWIDKMYAEMKTAEAAVTPKVKKADSSTPGFLSYKDMLRYAQSA